MTGIGQTMAQEWIDRWDAQQQAYLPDREQRFGALIEAVAKGAGDAPLEIGRASCRERV